MVIKSRVCCSLALLACRPVVSFTWISPRLLLQQQKQQQTRTRTRTRTRHLYLFSTSMSMSMSSESSTNSEVVANNLNSVREKIQLVCTQHGIPLTSVRLVAVSKTKPNELLMDAYSHGGQRHFGENYVQELVAKATTLPNDIHWHFIGPLQSNKAHVLVNSVVPNAASLTVETVSTLKLAIKLNKAMESLERDNDHDHDNNIRFLDIFIQVNTSGEESKSGVTPNDNAVVTICQEILDHCPRLKIKGLMTIGAPGDLECFDTLVSCKNKLMNALAPAFDDSLELSMGMSGDYEQAIARGATNVRVGSTIFGERDYSKKA